MLSKYFIDRPVFASVIAIIISIAGVLAISSLPVSTYPDVVPPQVVVSASYPGASAEDIATTVAAPLEQAINGVENMLYMTSTSSDSGSMQLTVTFAIGTNAEQATIDVNNRVQSAMSQLPQAVKKTGVTVRKRSTSILQVVMLYSPKQTYNPTYIANYGIVNVLSALKRVKGVGQAQLFSSRAFSMRIWLNPSKMAKFGITVTDVKQAIRKQNSQFAAGYFGATPYGGADMAFTYKATTPGRFSSVEQFRNVILKALDNGRVLHLADVARVELGAQSYSVRTSFNGKPAVAMAVYLSPGSNALATAERVKEKMEEVAQGMPEGLTYAIPFNTTKFVEASVHEVILTLVISLVLVMAIIFAFLQNVRATLIPMLAVPVALLGTFGGMYILGFSINLLTLFGMILAIGMVVDDAIVVIENIERHISEEGLRAREAAIQAMKEVAGPVVAIVLSLDAVFLPVAFISGLAGQFYRQFAITIAISITISGFVALTLTPALCALFLKPRQGQPLLPFRLFNRAFTATTHAYLWGVRFLLRHAVLGVILFFGVIGATWVVSQQVPSGLLPKEDKGYIFALYRLPPASSLQRTADVGEQLTNKILNNIPAVENIVSVTGFDFLAGAARTFAGVAFITLSDWGERDTSSFEAIRKVFALGNQIPSARILAFNPPPITGLSTTGGFAGYLQSVSGSDYEEIYHKAQQFIAALNKRPELTGVRTTLIVDVPRYHINVDRAKAITLGVPVQNLYDTLQATFGRLYVNQFTMLGRNWQVNLQSQAKYRMKPSDLSNVYVQSTKTGEMIPVSSLVSVQRTTAADIVQRYNVFPAAPIRGKPAPGYSSGQAIQAVQEVAQHVLGQGYQFQFTGTAYQATHVGSTKLIALGFAILMVFLILAAQYERWTLPLAVITAVPFAALGALVAIWLRGLSSSIYVTVGMLVLIGLAAKNAILIVEFAILERQSGKSIKDAAYSAASLRFRPIVMTSLTFIGASLPLAFASGAAASSRIAIGTVVIGGMVAATVFAILFVPLAYDLFQRASEKMSGHSSDTGDTGDTGGGPLAAGADSDHRLTEENEHKLEDRRDGGDDNHA